MERTANHHAALARDLSLSPLNDAYHFTRHDPMRLPDAHLRRTGAKAGAIRERYNHTTRALDEPRLFGGNESSGLEDRLPRLPRFVLTPPSKPLHVEDDDRPVDPAFFDSALPPDPRYVYQYQERDAVKRSSDNERTGVESPRRSRRVAEDRTERDWQGASAGTRRHSDTLTSYSPQERPSNGRATPTTSSLKRPDGAPTGYVRQGNYYVPIVATQKEQARARQQLQHEQQLQQAARYERVRRMQNQSGMHMGQLSPIETNDPRSRSSGSGEHLWPVCRTVSRDETATEDVKNTSRVKFAMEPHIRNTKMSQS
jgi:hypothetical protein